NLNGCFDARLSTPQLPAYALALTEQFAKQLAEHASEQQYGQPDEKHNEQQKIQPQIAGIAYAMVSARDATLMGIAREQSLALTHGAINEPGERRGAGAMAFSALQQRWSLAIDTLLNEIAQGYAAHRSGPGVKSDIRLAPYAMLLRDYIDSESLYGGNSGNSSGDQA
ncbi:MAG: hypothetical protein HKO07_00925, partial [Pseudomonadales bacterium]|nr:hypothetical protein [Pseudomonadales bacterium]